MADVIELMNAELGRLRAENTRLKQELYGGGEERSEEMARLRIENAAMRDALDFRRKYLER